MNYYMGQVDGGGDGGGGDVVGGIIDLGSQIIGGILGNFGGGYDDQATTYRPPSDSATRYVCFNDRVGNYCVAYDATSSASLNKAVANGNRLDDVYSYYSVFLHGNTTSGCSPAASRVVGDYASKQNVSIQRAGEELCYICGLTQSVRPAIPGTTQMQQAATPTTTGAPFVPPSIPTPLTVPTIVSPLPVPQVAAPGTPATPTATDATGATDNSWLYLLLLAGAVIFIARR